MSPNLLVKVAIGVVLSMFTAVLVTRTFLQTFLGLTSGVESDSRRLLVGH